MFFVAATSAALLVPTAPSLRAVAPRMVVGEDAAKAAWLARLDGPMWGNVAPAAMPPPPPAPAAYAPVASVLPPKPSEDAAKAAWLASIDQEPSWVTSPRTAYGRPLCTLAFEHRPIDFFGLHNLAAKGTRRSQGSLVDVGEPQDFSRPLDKDGMWCGARVGSWACTEGGWDSPKLRPTTETFLVLDGEGCVTDQDGFRHFFGPGDVVVLPKHWCGRWDISRQIHKVWVVHDHADVPGAADGIVRAVVAPVPELAPMATPIVSRALYDAPANMASTIYDVGPTRVGFLSCSPGDFVVAERPAAEIFFVVEGVFYLTNHDGTARRCTAGDTVVLPKGWAGHWNIIEPVRKAWVEVSDY